MGDNDNVESVVATADTELANCEEPSRSRNSTTSVDVDENLLREKEK